MNEGWKLCKLMELLTNVTIFPKFVKRRQFVLKTGHYILKHDS